MLLLPKINFGSNFLQTFALADLHDRIELKQIDWNRENYYK